MPRRIDHPHTPTKRKTIAMTSSSFPVCGARLGTSRAITDFSAPTGDTLCGNDGKFIVGVVVSDIRRFLIKGRMQVSTAATQDKIDTVHHTCATKPHTPTCCIATSCVVTATGMAAVFFADPRYVESLGQPVRELQITFMRALTHVVMFNIGKPVQ